MKRPGRALITPTRSDSIAASSSAWVISTTVAPVSRHSRSNSSPINSRVCWSSAPNGSSSRISLRPQHQRARDADALPHAAGELRRIMIGELREPHEADGVIDALGDLRLRQARGAQAERDILPDAEPAHAGIVLEHDADAFRNLAAQFLAFEAHAAAGRTDEAAEHVEQGRLAAAGGPDDGEELSGADLQVDRPERVDDWWPLVIPDHPAQAYMRWLAPRSVIHFAARRSGGR